MSHYTRFFGFDARPFDADGRQSPVMGTQALKTAFARIDSALDEGVKALLVSGPHGVGKSSLARALPRLLDGSRRISLIQDPGSRELESALAAALSSPAPREGETDAPILIIDDAEDLPAASAKKLGEALSSSTDTPRLACILLMTSTPSESNSSPPIRLEIENLATEEVPLEPLSRTGVNRYIQKHLERVGGRSEELFPEDAVEAIYRLTGGLPREVSRLCEELLETAARRQAKTVDPEWLDPSPEPGSEAVSKSRGPVEWPAPGSLGKAARFTASPQAAEPLSSVTSEIAYPVEDLVPRVAPQTVEPHTRWARWAGLAVGLIGIGSLAILVLDPFGQSEVTPEEPSRPADAMNETSIEAPVRQTTLGEPAPSALPELFRPRKAPSLTISSSIGPLELTAPKSSEARATHTPKAPAGLTETQQILLMLETMADAIPDLPRDPIKPEDS